MSLKGTWWGVRDTKWKKVVNKMKESTEIEWVKVVKMTESWDIKRNKVVTSNEQNLEHQNERKLWNQMTERYNKKWKQTRWILWTQDQNKVTLLTDILLESNYLPNFSSPYWEQEVRDLSLMIWILQDLLMWTAFLNILVNYQSFCKFKIKIMLIKSTFYSQNSFTIKCKPALQKLECSKIPSCLKHQRMLSQCLVQDSSIPRLPIEKRLNISYFIICRQGCQV